MTAPFFQLHLAIELVAKERPRVNKKTGAVYTPQRTRDFEKELAQAVRLAASSPANKVDDLWIHQEFHIAGQHRKDLDNLLKICWDAITLSGAVWGDDKQVTDSSESVRYGAAESGLTISVGVARPGTPRSPRSNARSRKDAKPKGPMRRLPTGYDLCPVCQKAAKRTAVATCRNCA